MRQKQSMKTQGQCQELSAKNLHFGNGQFGYLNPLDMPRSMAEHICTGCLALVFRRLSQVPSCSVSTVPNKKASTLQRWLRIGHFAGDDGKLRK